MKKRKEKRGEEPNLEDLFHNNNGIMEQRFKQNETDRQTEKR